MTRHPDGGATSNGAPGGRWSTVLEFLQATDLFGSVSQSDLEDLVPTWRRCISARARRWSAGASPLSRSLPFRVAGAQGPAPSRLASPPSIGALLLRSAELGGALEERSSPDSAADLHLRPPTGHYTLMDFNASAADALFEAGFAYTTAELKRTGMGAVLAPPRQLGDLRRPTG